MTLGLKHVHIGVVIYFSNKPIVKMVNPNDGLTRPGGVNNQGWGDKKLLFLNQKLIFAKRGIVINTQNSQKLIQVKFSKNFFW